jgi:hypothetical protein
MEKTFMEAELKDELRTRCWPLRPKKAVFNFAGRSGFPDLAFATEEPPWKLDDIVIDKAAILSAIDFDLDEDLSPYICIITIRNPTSIRKYLRYGKVTLTDILKQKLCNQPPKRAIKIVKPSVKGDNSSNFMDNPSPFLLDKMICVIRQRWA